MRIARIAASAALLAAALTGCTAAPAAPAAPSASTAAPGPLPDGVTVSFGQLRSDVAARQAEVQVTNGTDAVLTVGELAVTDPRFDAPIRRVVARESRIAPGATVGIRVQLTDAACPAPSDAEASVTLAYALGGDEGVATADLPDPLGFVAPLHDRECRAAALADAVKLSFSGFTPSPAGQPAALDLTLVPTGRAAATVAGIQTTNLLTFDGIGTADTYSIAYDARPGDSGAAVVTLPIVPLRCDAHAVQEDKRGTIFTLEVAVDGEAGEIELAAPDDLRGRILTWVGQWCGFGG